MVLVTTQYQPVQIQTLNGQIEQQYRIAGEFVSSELQKDINLATQGKLQTNSYNNKEELFSALGI